MNLPVEVPGLDAMVPSIAGGATVLVDGGADLAKSFFVRGLCRTAARVPRPVTFLTSKDEAELQQMFQREDDGAGTPERVRMVERSSLEGLTKYVEDDGLLVVDSFSFLALDLPSSELARTLRDLRKANRAHGSVGVLATDSAMLDARANSIVTHLSECQVSFHAQEGTEGVVRFLRVPKWWDGRFVDRNVYYSFDGKRLAVDLRNRVL